MYTQDSGAAQTVRTRVRASQRTSIILLDRVHKPRVCGGAHHVAPRRVARLVDAQPLDGDAQDLGLGEDRALAVRLRPLLVVHVALGVGRNTGQVVAELKVVTSNKLCEPIL